MSSPTSVKRRRVETGGSAAGDAAQSCFEVQADGGGRGTYSITVRSPVDRDTLLAKLRDCKFEDKSTKGLELTMLVFKYEYDDDTPLLDFSGDAEVVLAGDLGSATLNSFLASVKRLSFTCCPFAAFTGVNLPQCTRLEFHNSGEAPPDFCAPKLTSIWIQFCTYGGDDVDKVFAKSLNRSPYLCSFASYKLWGVRDLGSLYLPSVEDLSFYRADGLSSLKLYAPRLKMLDLRAAYAISKVSFLSRGSGEHKGLMEVAAPGEKGTRPLNLGKKDFSRFKLDVVNGGPRKETCIEWANWPRVSQVLWECDDEGFAIGMGCGSDRLSADDSADEGCEDDSGDEDSDGGPREPLPLEVVTVGGISDAERRNRARWIRSEGS